jgi:hypothetical protein
MQKAKAQSRWLLSCPCARANNSLHPYSILLFYFLKRGRKIQLLAKF